MGFLPPRSLPSQAGRARWQKGLPHLQAALSARLSVGSGKGEDQGGASPFATLSRQVVETKQKIIRGKALKTLDTDYRFVVF
jgi:hypothetical protein